jgi:hypothetical protein
MAEVPFMSWRVLMSAVVLVGAGCAHHPRPERRSYVIAESTEGVGTSLGVGGSGLRDCDEEHVQCFDACWNTKSLPWPYTKRDGWFHEYCTKQCRQRYLDCEKDNETRAGTLEFSRIDDAMEWLEKHKAEVALGTVVVIAGVAFVLSTGGAGALVLVPLAL